MRFPLIAVLLVTALLSGACSTAEEATTTSAALPTTTTIDANALERYESPSLGFAIEYPAGWTVIPSPVEGLVGFTAPLGSDTIAPNFNVSTGSVPEEVSALDYYAVERDRLDAMLAELRVLEEVDINIDGYPGRGFTLLTTQQGIEVGISRIIVLAEGRAFEVTFFAEASQMPSLSPLVTAILASFDILD
jgi:hypothetical protein